MIKSLPSDLKNHLRSSITITSIAQCVEELVLNSIDACATCIAIRIDVNNSKVQVVDNGHGIQRDDLDLIGCRYLTSKCHDIVDLDEISYFGYRGEVLASIRHLCEVLEISTRHKLSSETYICTFYLGASQVIHKATVKRPSCGTTVTVSNLFHRCPIRRKWSNDITHLSCILACVEAIALIHPEISFSVRNDITGKVLLKTPKTDSIISVFGRLFSQQKSKFLKELRHQSGNIQIHGYVSTELHHNRDLQLLYVNKRCVKQSELEQLIGQSLGKVLLARQKKDAHLASNQTGSPSRTKDRYAIYVINISCPISVYNILSDLGKTCIEFKDRRVVHQLIEDAIKEFLYRENIIKSPLEELPTDVKSLSEPPTEHSANEEVSTCYSYGKSISTVDLSNALHSISVGRAPLRKAPHCTTTATQSVIQDTKLVALMTTVTATMSVTPTLSANAFGATEHPLSCHHSAPCTSAATDGENLSLGVTQLQENDPELRSTSAGLSQLLHTAQLLNTSKCEQDNCDTVHRDNGTQLLDNTDSFTKMLLFSDGLPASSSDGSSTSRCKRDKTFISLSSPEVDLSMDAIRKADEKPLPKLKPHNIKGISPRWYKIREKLANRERTKRNQPVVKDTDVITLGTKQEMDFCRSQTFIEGCRKGCSALGKDHSKNDTNYIRTPQTENMALALSIDSSGIEQSAVKEIKTSRQQEGHELALVVMNGKQSGNSKMTDDFMHQLKLVTKPNNVCQSLDATQDQRANGKNKKPDESTGNTSSVRSDSSCSQHWHPGPLGQCYVESRQHAGTEHMALPSSIMTMESMLLTRENVNFDELGIDIKTKKVDEPSQPKKRRLASVFITDSDGQTVCKMKSKNPSNHAENGLRNYHRLYFVENSQVNISMDSDLLQASKWPQNINTMNIDQSEMEKPESSSYQRSDLIETHNITVTSTASNETRVSNCADSRKCITQPEICQNSNVSCCSKSCSSSSELGHHNTTTVDPNNGGIGKNSAAVEIMEKMESEGFSTAQMSQSFMIFPQTQEFSVQKTTPFYQHQIQEFHLQTQSPDGSVLNHSDSTEGSTRKVSVYQDNASKSVSEVQHSNYKIYSEHPNNADVAVTKIPCAMNKDDTIQDRASDFENSHNVMHAEGQTVQINHTKQVVNEHLDNRQENNTVDTNQTVKDEINKCQDVTVVCQMRTDANIKYVTTEHEIIVSGMEEPGEMLLEQSPLHTGKWLHQVDKTGRGFYVNKQTGFSSYTKPETTKQPNALIYTLTRSHPMRQCTNSLLETFRHQVQELKMASSKSTSLSPGPPGHLMALFNRHKEALGNEEHRKWRSEEYKFEQKETKALNITEMFTSWNNQGTNRLEKDILSIERLAKDHCMTSTHQVLSSYKLNKDDLHMAKVIGQLDNKFIVCLLVTGSSRLLVLIDQHAAHERLRLETLIHESLDISGGQHQYHSLTLMPSLEMILDKDLISSLCSYRNQFKKFGLEFTLPPATDNKAIIHALPTCLIMKESSQSPTSGRSVPVELIENFIKEEARLLRMTHGACEAVPQTFVRCLASVACHGAIKFGDKLTLLECAELVSSLSACDLPFQCAHGRPSAVPLLDLNRLYDTFSNKTRDKPRVSRLSARMRLSEERQCTEIKQESSDRTL